MKAQQHGGLVANSERCSLLAVWRRSRDVIIQPEQGKVTGPDRSFLKNATNGLFAPDECTQEYHYRACHLVLGLAELFVEYGRTHTATAILKKWMGKDVVIKKKERAAVKGKGHGGKGKKGKSSNKGKSSK